MSLEVKKPTFMQTTWWICESFQ